MSDIDFLALERELPSLNGLRRFAHSLNQIDWFGHLGEPLKEKERQAALTYLDHLGFPDADIAQLIDWEDAALAAETMDWSTPAWEAEELARADLTMRALDYVSEDALQVGLTVVSEQAGEAIRGAMEEAASIWDVVEDDMQNLAVGSAVQACHHVALALIVTAADPQFEMDQHLFAAKFKLFELGRWPVGVTGNSFNLF